MFVPRPLPSGAEFLPNTQPDPLLMQLLAIPLGPVADAQALVDTKSYQLPLLLNTKSQSLFLGLGANGHGTAHILWAELSWLG